MVSSAMLQSNKPGVPESSLPEFPVRSIVSDETAAAALIDQHGKKVEEERGNNQESSTTQHDRRSHRSKQESHKQ